MKNVYKFQNKDFSTHNQLIRLVGTGKMVLDLGCNEGYLGMKMGVGNIFYGIDVRTDLVEKAKKFYCDAIVMDLNSLSPLAWQVKFDVIIFADILEHLISPESALIFFSNYLASNGRVIISLPNIANWRIRWGLLTGSFDYTETGILDKTHLHFYTYKTAINLLTISGFHVEQVSFGASIVGFMINILPRFLSPILATGIIITAKKVN